jgi:hypothetical protein
MRITFDSVKHHHALAVIILLIVAALALGATACDGARTYQLAISSGSGGNVTTPGEGTFTYDAGAAVPLLATPDDGYEFHLWTGDIEHIARPNLASTTITMNGSYAIVANFEAEGEIGPGEEADHEQ